MEKNKMLRFLLSIAMFGLIGFFPSSDSFASYSSYSPHYPYLSNFRNGDWVVEKTETKDSNGTVGSDTIHTFDSDGYLIKREFDFYNNGTIDSFLIYTYDNSHHDMKEVDYHEDGTSHATLFTYDKDWNETKREYDDENDGIIDKVEVYTYDSDGKLIKKEDDKDNDGIIDAVRTFFYNSSGNLTRSEYVGKSGSIGIVHTYQYDSDGNMIKRETDVDNDGTIDCFHSYSYDSMGNNISEVYDADCDGTIDTNYFYTLDSNGRAIKIESDYWEASLTYTWKYLPLSSSSSGDDNDGDGYTTNQGDCNDSNKNIYPDAIEICGDGIDQDCDGKDESCITTTIPSPPTGVSASDGTVSGKVQVTWNLSSGASSYDIYRADMPAWTGTAPKRIASSVSGASYDDTTASSGNRYYYWVKARNSGGISKYSMFDAGYWGSMGSIPSVVTNVSATDGTVSGEVCITWTATVNTLVYEIWRADIPAFLGGTLKKIGTCSTASYCDTTVVIGNCYHYWIKARNSWGVCRYSIFDTGYCGDAVLVLPAPTGVIASGGHASGRVNITWNTVSGAVIYEVWRATDLVSNGGTPRRVGFLSGTSFDDTTGVEGTTYYYWVKARNSWGSSRYSFYDTGYCGQTISPPSLPGGITVSDGSCENMVCISWDPCSGATSYVIYKSTSADGEKEFLTETTETFFNDTAVCCTGLCSNILYHYWIKAKNAYGESDFSIYDTGFCGRDEE